MHSKSIEKTRPFKSNLQCTNNPTLRVDAKSERALKSTLHPLYE